MTRVLSTTPAMVISELMVSREVALTFVARRMNGVDVGLSASAVESQRDN
jgi:hypothetical protein